MLTIEDLVKAGKNQVRSNPDLMSAYISIFEQAFGRKPDCAGCTFDNDWGKLVNSNQEIGTLMEKTFEIIDKGEIFAYNKFDEKIGREVTIRSFGRNMTEEFAREYLTHGTPEQIEERKRFFRVLPKMEDSAEKKETQDLSKLSLDKLKKLAAQYPQEEWKSLKKEDLITYLNSKEVEK